MITCVFKYSVRHSKVYFVSKLGMLNVLLCKKAIFENSQVSQSLYRSKNRPPVIFKDFQNQKSCTKRRVLILNFLIHVLISSLSNTDKLKSRTNK